MGAKKQEPKAEKQATEDLDTGDIDRWVGVPLAGSNMREPVGVSDIRRWSQGMQNPNPLFYDDAYAGESRFGQVVAPQSFTVCTSDSGGGVAPAIQGKLPGTHVLFGGDEWWFYGPRVFAGDKIRQDRMLFDYRITQTKFAGPTLITRGDTTYINQRGEIIAKQRATAIRYRTDLALERRQYADDVDPEWTDEELASVEKQRFEWIQSILDLGHDRRLGVKAGDKIVRRPIGPHSAMTLATEWRSFPVMLWGAFSEEETGFSSTEGSDWSGEAGWLPELARDPEGAKVDPSLGDGLYKGPARGHVDTQFSKKIGLPRLYGFGVTMGAWMLDYVNAWVGEWGEVAHANMQYRQPTFSGDVAFIDGEVSGVAHDDPLGIGRPIASVQLTMTNQKKEVIAKGTAKVRLPTETLPDGDTAD